jgi:DNA end-binding protein Ku
LPANNKAEEIYDVFAEAMRANGKAGIGQITLRGREELCALLPFEQGLIIETLRYKAELDEIPEIYTEKNYRKSKADYVSLARQLIKENTHSLHLEKYHDHYHEALMELIDAKQKHRKPRLPAPSEKPTKIVNFAEALKRSLKIKGRDSAARTPKRRRSA